MTKSTLVSIALMFVFTISKAQKNVYFTITHKLASSNFAFNQISKNDMSQDFKITRVDYYISSIKIIHDGGMVKEVPNKYILVKGNANVNELLGNFDVTNVEGIQFSIGVEAPTNNADPSLQPAGSPLSFQSPSMHWGWSSGYRFIALEGKTGSNFTTTFEMHGLGNSNYFNQTKMVAGVTDGTNNIFINLNADYTKALNGINISNGPIDHGVNATDLKVLQNFRDYVFSPGTPTSTSKIEDNFGVNIYPNPSTDKLFINFNNNEQHLDNIVFTDITGKIHFEQPLQLMNEINLNNFAKGVYFIQFFEKNSIVTTHKIVIQ